MRQHRDRSDAGVRFELALNEGNPDSGGRTTLSTQYVLKAEFYVGREVSSMDYLNNYMEFSLDYDRTKADLRKITDVALYRYDDVSGDWQKIYERYNSYDIVIRTTINRLGKYGIFGARR